MCTQNYIAMYVDLKKLKIQLSNFNCVIFLLCCNRKLCSTSADLDRGAVWILLLLINVYLLVCAALTCSSMPVDRQADTYQPT